MTHDDPIFGFTCIGIILWIGHFLESIHFFGNAENLPLYSDVGLVLKMVDFEVRKSAKFENPGKSEFNRILENPDF